MKHSISYTESEAQIMLSSEPVFHCLCFYLTPSRGNFVPLHGVSFRACALYTETAPQQYQLIIMPYMHVTMARKVMICIPPAVKWIFPEVYISLNTIILSLLYTNWPQPGLKLIHEGIYAGYATCCSTI